MNSLSLKMTCKLKYMIALVQQCGIYASVFQGPNTSLPPVDGREVPEAPSVEYMRQRFRVGTHLPMSGHQAPSPPPMGGTKVRPPPSMGAPEIFAMVLEIFAGVLKIFARVLGIFARVHSWGGF